MLEKRIRKLEKIPERKWFDTNIGYTVIPAEPVMAFRLLNCVPIEGTAGTTAATSRQSTEITSVMLGARLSIRQQTANLIENRIRFCFFWYSEQNTLQAVVGNIFDLTSLPLTFTFRNRYNDDDYSVFKDKIVELIPPTNLTTTTIVPGVRHFEFQWTMKRRVSFNTTNGNTFADITQNGLWFGISTSTPDGATTSPQYALSTRYLFLDG